MGYDAVLPILFIDSAPTYGGAFEQLLRISTHLARDKNLSLHIALAQQSEEAFNRIPHGITSYSFSAPPRKTDWPDALSSFPLNLTTSLYDLLTREIPQFLRLSRISYSARPRIIFLNNILSAQLPGVAAAILKGAHCISCHQDFVSPSRLVNFAKNRISHHVAISTAVEQHLLGFGIRPENISLIHNCADTRVFSPDQTRVDLASAFQIPEHKKVFAIFGRLIRWKGIHEFIHSARIVLDQYPDAHGLIVGSISSNLGKKYQMELFELVDKLGLAEHITFAGYRADIPQLMRSVDIIVHQSTRPEPFGLVVVEGMASGKPVVAMREGGPLDIITDGEDGLLVEPRNPAAVARGILTFLRDSDLSARVGAAARETVLTKFSAETQATKYAELFTRVLTN